MEQVLSDTGLTDLEYHVNLAYSPEMGATALQETLPMYLGMVLVFLAGYLIIYNIFQISVTADVQFYGKLKTLGMTTKQIKKLIFGQSNLLCLIGIPAGLLLGWLLGMVLVPAFTGIIEGESRVSANPVIFIGSAVFAWLTVLVSCLRPARLAFYRDYRRREPRIGKSGHFYRLGCFCMAYCAGFLSASSETGGKGFSYGSPSDERCRSQKQKIQKKKGTDVSCIHGLGKSGAQ